MRLFSASSRYLVQKCPPSHVLPQVRETRPSAEEGKEGHIIMEGMPIPEALGFEGQKYIEAAFIYQPETRNARFLGCQKNREYGKLAPGEIPGTADLIVHGDGRVGVWDHKFRDTWVEPAAENPQLQILALMASTYFKVSEVTAGWTKYDRKALPEIVPGYSDRAVFDAFDLESIAEAVQKESIRLQIAHQKIGLGKMPDVSAGEHCTYCEARRSCPAKTGLMRAALGQPAHFLESLRALAPEQVGELYYKLRPLQAALHALRAEIEEMAREQPITMPDGKVLMLTEGKAMERVVDAKLVAEYLAIKFGPEVAIAACDLESSKAQIGRALDQAKVPKSEQTLILNALRASEAIAKVPGKPRVEVVTRALPGKDEEAA